MSVKDLDKEGGDAREDGLDGPGRRGQLQDCNLSKTGDLPVRFSKACQYVTLWKQDTELIPVVCICNKVSTKKRKPKSSVRGTVLI